MTKFYGIGIGPGDRELITIKASRILKDVDVVIIPESKRGNGSIAYDIAKDYINPKADIIYAEFPMVKDSEIMYQAGADTAKIIEDYFKKGKSTAFITLGDPSIYSTYTYILHSLSSWVSVETIPGITSFCAAAAELNKPLVIGKEILSIIPATSTEETIRKSVQSSQAMAFMKIFNHRDKIIEILREESLLDHSTLVKKCTMADCTIEQDIEDAFKKEKQYLSIVLSRRDK